MSQMREHYGSSICPTCLRTIPSLRFEKQGKVYVTKTCPEHGVFETVIWGNASTYDAWAQGSTHAKRIGGSTDHPPCPGACGLCSEHEGDACVVVIPVIDACNMHCTVCFADSNSNQEALSLATIERLFRACLEKPSAPSVQLSGGEPTLHNDLESIVKRGKDMGLPHIQLNTNGILLSQDLRYVQSLKEAGLDLVYLQFDGVEETTYKAIRGRNCLNEKMKAIENCSKAELGVILVPTIIPNINDSEIGAIISFARERIDTVKGIHFQPVSYFGRYPKKAALQQERITIPDLLKRIEEQTNGEITATMMQPRKKFDAHCSFSASFVQDTRGVLHPLSQTMEESTKKVPVHPDQDVFALESIEYTNRFWRKKETTCCSKDDDQSPASWIENHRLSLSGMHFQDAWTLELDRLKGCCVFVLQEDERFIPFCSYYLTSTQGSRLYGPSR